MSWRRKIFYGVDVQRLAAVLEIFLIGHPNGFDIMLGRSPFPESEAIVQVLQSLTARETADLGARIQCVKTIFHEQRVIETAETVTAIIARAGGMERVVVVFNAHAASKSLRWRALADWHRGITTVGANKRGLEHTLTKCYRKHPITLKREREELLLAIADEIIYPRVTDC